MKTMDNFWQLTFQKTTSTNLDSTSQLDPKWRCVLIYCKDVNIRDLNQSNRDHFFINRTAICYKTGCEAISCLQSRKSPHIYVQTSPHNFIRKSRYNRKIWKLKPIFVYLLLKNINEIRPVGGKQLRNVDCRSLSYDRDA